LSSRSRRLTPRSASRLTSRAPVRDGAVLACVVVASAHRPRSLRPQITARFGTSLRRASTNEAPGWRPSGSTPGRASWKTAAAAVRLALPSLWTSWLSAD
jgi:hypothetical protein